MSPGTAPMTATLNGGTDHERYRPNPQNATGKGVTGKVDGHTVALGNIKLLEDAGIDVGDLSKQADSGRAEGQTMIFVAVDGRAAGLLDVADPIKSSTPEAIRVLREEGIEIVMLTGDNRKTAEAVPASWASTGCRRRCCRIRRRPWSSSCRRKARRWPWRATASTMPPRWRRLRWASPWAPVPTSPWKARVSPSSREICAVSCAPGVCPAPPCATSVRICSSLSSITR